MKLMNIAMPAMLALAVAGCQTAPRGPINVTQQVYGNVDPKVPANWASLVTRSGSIAYVCPVESCKEPGAIGYTVAHINADAEYLVREKVISAGLLQEMGKSMTSVTDGRFRQISVRDLTNNKAAGFENATSVETPAGTFYSVSRVGINNNELRVVTGVGKSIAKARQNLRIGLNGVR